MTLRRRCAYVGIVAVLCALTLRIGGGASPLQDPQFADFLAQLQTGRPHTERPSETPTEESTGTVLPDDPDGPLKISLQAGLKIQCENGTAYETQLEKWFTAPLTWDLKKGTPTVLIVHTHATESYKNTGEYKESDPYRTTEESYNMLRIGERLEEMLLEAGISVIHDRTLHDYPLYKDAYARARETIQAQLDAHPEICLVLDLHRDAKENEQGEQVGLTAQYGTERAAMLELVVGTGEGGQANDMWESNASLAVKLQVALEEFFPGICRPVVIRSSRYNQDLSQGALIVEIGTAGNTQQEAIAGVEVLGKALIAMAKGVEITE